MTVSAQFASPLPSTGESLGSGLIPSTALPVVFFDGNHETDVGSVMVDGTLRFSRLMSNICSRIGMSPHQISLFLVRRKKTRSPAARALDGRRKIPIDEGSDFSSIARERDCIVLVTLRRSSRKGKASRRNLLVDGRSAEEKANAAAAMVAKSGAQHRIEKKTILRRPSSELLAKMSAHAKMNSEYYPGSWDYDAAAMMTLEMERESYFMPPGAASIADPYFNFYYVNSYPSSDVCKEAAFCKICAGEEGDTSPEFHCCVNDTVTRGFRSKFGPIQRPRKRSDRVSAYPHEA